MLAVFSLILKVLGLLLLAVICIALLIIFVVLLVPVRYRFQGAYFEKPEAKARVTWLLHLISASAEYREELQFRLKILGFTVFSSEKKEEVSEGSREKTESDRTAVHAREPEQPAGDEKLPYESMQTEYAADVGVKEPEEPGKEKITARFVRIYSKIREGKDKVSAFLNDQQNRKTLRLLKRQIFRLIRHLFPRSLTGRVRFGFEDPYLTGQVLTWISPFYGLYAGKLEIIPLFDRKILEGEAACSGRIRLGTVLVIVIRVIFNKNFRRLFREFRNRD